MSGTTVVTSSFMFSERDQSIWGGGTATTIVKTIPIIDLHEKTGPQSLDIGLGVVSISGAQIDLDVDAIINFTTGSMSLDYPLDVAVDLPTQVAPGQAFSVQTRVVVVEGAAPMMVSTSPGFEVGFKIGAYAGINNLYFESAELNVDLGLFSFNANPIPDIPFGSPHLGPYSTYIGIPLSKTLSYKGLDITVAVPAPFSSTADTFVPSDRVLPELQTAGDQYDNDAEGGLDAGFLTVSGNIMNMSPIPTSFKVSKFELTSLAVNLIGGLGFAQEYTFTPTQINVAMETGWHEVVTGKLGDALVFHQPANWYSDINLSTTYSMQGNLETKSGIVGSFGIGIEFGSLTVAGINIGTIYEDEFPIYKTGTYYPGIATVNEPLGGFNDIFKTYTIPLGAGAIKTVSTEAELNAAIDLFGVGGAGANVNTQYTIDLAADLILSTTLRAVNLMDGSTLVFNGGGHTIDGGGQFRGLMVLGGTLKLNHVDIAHTAATGGKGGDALGEDAFGGGGGAGLGGGLFVGNGAAAVLDDVDFIDDSATGGAGGGRLASAVPGSVGGGGGGMGGAGGDGVLAGGVPVAGLGGGLYPGTFAASELGAGGAGASSAYDSGADGSFGGGGGGGGGLISPSGGHGGFGGGGGGSYSGDLAGIGGGYGSIYGGGGGLGAGGAIYVRGQGSLTYVSGGISGGAVTGGLAASSGNKGQALGSGIYNGNRLVLAPEAGQQVTISDDIAGGGYLLVKGAGVAVLSGANSFTGGVELRSGTLELHAPLSGGYGMIRFIGGLTDDGHLVIDADAMSGTATAMAFSTPLGVFTGGDTIALPDLPFDATTRSVMNDGTLSIISGAKTVQLQIALRPELGRKLSSDGHGGTLLSVGGTPTVSTRGDFNAVVGAISSGGYLAQAGKSYFLDITDDFAVDGDLADIALMAGSTLVIRGHGKTMDGGDLYRGIQVDSGTVTLESLTIANMRARGGDGGGGGGGGAGMGGGLFVAAAGNVVLDRVTFTSNIAEGGSGSVGFDGPGGGLNGGAGGGLAGPLDALDPDRRQSGGFGGGGGTAGLSQYGGAAGYGGGGGSSSVYGGLSNHDDGAGNGAIGFGGGGDGIAADIYAQGGLTILGTASVSGGTVLPGQSGGGEAKAGGVGDASIFANGFIGLATQAGETIRLAGGIGGGLSVGGAGTVVLSGANSVGGGTVLSSGTLELGNPWAVGEVGSTSWSLGTGWVQFTGAATLVLTNAALVGSGTELAYPGLIDGFTLGDTIRLPGLPFDAAATVSSEGKDAVLTAGGTSVTLTGLGGFFAPAPVDDGSGGTMLRGGLTARVDTQAELDAALIAMSFTPLSVDDHLAGGGGALGAAYVIDIIGDFTLSHDMLPIYLGAGSSLTVNGNGHRVDGADLYQGFDLRLGSLTLRSLTVADMLARGGSGFGGGGGGGGFGGALFIGADTQVVLSNVDFDSNGAVGGAGAAGSNGTGGASNGVEGGYYPSGAFGVGGRPLDDLAAGGFGGGGGGAPTGGVAGYGAGAGVPGAGGGGLAAGGSIFVQENGTLRLEAGRIGQGNLVPGKAGGSGAGDGGAAGDGLFLQDGLMHLSPRAGETLSVAGGIAGPGVLWVDGAGTVDLSGDNSFSGGLAIVSGRVVLHSGQAAGTGSAILAGGALDLAGLAGATTSFDAASQMFTAQSGARSMSMKLAGAPSVTSTGANMVLTAGFPGSATIGIAVDDATRPEGNTGSTPFTFIASRTGDTSAAAQADWTVAGSGANPATTGDMAGGTFGSGTVVFAIGETQQTITIGVQGDATQEADESFTVTLSAPSGATLGTAAATGVITDDDGSTMLSISANTPSRLEGNSGNDPFDFTVTRTGNLDLASTASIVVVIFGHARVAGSVSFAAGEAQKTVSLDFGSNSIVQIDQSFSVALNAASAGTTINTKAASVGITVLNDDAALEIAATDASKPDGNSGSSAFTFTVTRSGYTDQASTADWAVTGTGLRPAVAGDFSGGVLPSGTVAFLAGETSKLISVPVIGDASEKPDHPFAVTLSAPSPGTSLGTASAAGTIIADSTIGDLAVVNSATGLPLAATPTYYNGPVAGVEKEFILIGPENINATANGDNWFIHTGSGTDGIAVHGGRNVLDGGTGSNFLTGGTGEDTFFLDNRDAASDIWSTVVGFGKGDSATVWGVTKEGFSISWLDDLGAEGFKGLTMLATAPGKPNALLTLAGFSNVDVDSGKLLVLFGAIDASTPYLYVYGAS